MDRLAAKSFDLGNDGLRLFCTISVGQDDIAAVTGDADCGVAAEPAAASRDDGNCGHI